MTFAATSVILLLATAGSPPTGDPSWYARRATWHESMLASRDALAAQERAAAATAGTVVAPRFGPWYGLGPFAISAANADLESNIVGLKVPDLVAEYPSGPEGGTRHWVLRLEYKDGWIHKLHEGEHVTYLRRAIHAPTAMSMPIHLDVMGEMTVWLNGAPVAAKQGGHIGYDVWGGDPAVRPTPIQLELTAGDNDLLVKIELHPQPRQPDDQDPWRKATLEARRPWGTVFNGYETHTGPAIEYEKLVYREVSNFYCSTAAVAGPVSDTAQQSREELWRLLRRDFTDDSARREMELERHQGLWTWEWTPGDTRELANRYAESISSDEPRLEARSMVARLADGGEPWAVRALYHRAKIAEVGARCLADEPTRKTLLHSIESLRLAIGDLIATYGTRYPNGAEYAARLTAVEQLVQQADSQGNADLFAKASADFDALRAEALLANPLLEFGQLLVVRRRANPHVPDLPFNWANNSSLSANDFDNEIAMVSPVNFGYTLKTVFKPDGRRFVGDLDLHFDGDRVLFSMPGSHERWQLFEVRTDGTGLRQVSRGDQPDVDNFDGCYLPSGKIIFCSTAVFAGVPCVKGRDHVGVLFEMDADGANMRQLCFEQDQDFCPTVLNDGRVLYTRWEYTDIPHFFSRLLFTMNPDGTDQKAYYGSNSYWPNGIFYAQPIPGHATQVVGVVSGHHAARRSGELVVFDPARGQHEATGVVQRIPGRGEKVEPVINDRLVAGSWPKTLHPFPLSDKYFLVSRKMNESSRWGIYLVDLFDNTLLLCEDEDHDLLEPVPVRARPRPPTIPDRVDRGRKDAVVNLIDVHAGPGLAGVPRGTVKGLRVIAYHYAYQGMADDSQAIGVDSSWDTVKIVLGTVPVQADGSAMFRVPANTPITVQPLDGQGRSLQLMRSWLTAMPGETQSCVGCHATANTTPSVHHTLASRLGPTDIEPWHGPARGFSFKREVQPVLNQYCVGCHKDESQTVASVPPAPVAVGAAAAASDGEEALAAGPFSLTDRPSTDPRGFSPSYLELHRFVRRPGAETDYHLLPAAEYHANVTELVQLLEKGHYNVRLDSESWDRLVTWIDLNVPFHGTWHEAQGKDRVGDQDARRRELRQLYAGLDDDPEIVFPVDPASVKPIVPEPLETNEAAIVNVPGWPFDAVEARRRQQADGPAVSRKMDLGQGVVMHLVRIPAGEFVMGDPEGSSDERPHRERIARSFWIGKFEVTNEQFTAFDPAHDSRYIRTHGITSTRGFPVNLPGQPVVRVSWDRAQEFCRWLSERTGEEFSLPTESMWEYACRAGTATSFSHGSLDGDFSPWANLADVQVVHLRDYSHNSQLAWIPRDSRFDDGAMVTAAVGIYQPNAWGVHDMHGNAAEWTRTAWSSSDLGPADGSADRKVIRGGSWHDRPARSRSSFRLAYPSWQQVHNVGFRVVCESRDAGG